jgi:hypothetical protein
MCFGLAWIENLLLWIIGVAVVIAVLKVLVPLVFGLLGIPLGGAVMQIINIIIVGILLTALVIIVFDLLGCVLGSGHGLLPGRVG